MTQSTVAMTALQPSDKARFKDASEAEQALREAWDRCLTQGLVHPAVLAMDETPHDKAPARMHEPRGGVRASPLTLGDSSEMTAVNDKPPAKQNQFSIESTKGRPGDDDPTKLPQGQLRILNYSPVKIAMRCNGKTAKELKTRESFVVPPQDGQVVYELAYDNQGKWKMQENNLLAVNPKEQAQLIVLKSDADFFTNSDGGRSGFLQKVVLRRPAEDGAP